MKTRSVLLGVVLGALPFFALFCTPGTSETGNACGALTGSIMSNNRAVANAHIQLVPDGFVPGRDAVNKVFTTKTIANGTYAFTDVPLGNYYLNAKSEGMRILRGPIAIDNPVEDLATDTLLDAAELTLEIPQTDTLHAIYIEGSAELWEVGSGPVVLNNVPSGKITIAGIPDKVAIKEPVTVLTVDVFPGDTLRSMPDNKPPVITSTEKTLSAGIDRLPTSYTEIVEAYDPDGGTLSFHLITAPEKMSIDTSTGKVTWQLTDSTFSATYRVGVLVADNKGGSRSVWWTISVGSEQTATDNQPPVITLIGGDTVRIPLGDPGNMLAKYIEQVTVIDKEGSAVTIAPPVSNVDIFLAGTYTITYSATDSHNNGATAIRYVLVTGEKCNFDRPPVINVKDTIIIIRGATYNPPVFVAYDACNQDITALVSMSGTVDTSLPGTYLITYQVRDAAANYGIKKLVVIVLENENGGPDTTSPKITLLGRDTMYVAGTLSAAQVIEQYREPGFTATDDRDGNITSRVVTSGVTALSAGTYVVTYNVKDLSGNNAATVRRLILTGNDKSPPVIVLTGKNPDTVIVGSSAAYNDPSATAFDSKDGDITSRIVVSGTVSMNTLSVFLLRYRVTDSDSNVATAARVVYVVADTGATDLRVKYGVPSPYPVPDLPGKVYHSVTVEGPGPDLSKVDSLMISWDLETNNLSQLRLFMGDTTRNLLQGCEHSMNRELPFIQPPSGGIALLNATLYIAVAGSEMYWVNQSGRYAIVWREQ